jgi:DNA-binding GntR family transcriptional regulator
MCEAGEGEAAAALLDEHLGRARERLVAAFGGEAGPEADVPSDLVSQ